MNLNLRVFLGRMHTQRSLIFCAGRDISPRAARVAVGSRRSESGGEQRRYIRITPVRRTGYLSPARRCVNSALGRRRRARGCRNAAVSPPPAARLSCKRNWLPADPLTDIFGFLDRHPEFEFCINIFTNTCPIHHAVTFPGYLTLSYN